MTEDRKDAIWPKVSGVVEAAQQMNKEGHALIMKGTAIAEEGRRLVAAASQLMKTMKGVPGAPELEHIETPAPQGHVVHYGFWRKNIIPILAEKGAMSTTEIVDEIMATRSSYVSPDRHLVYNSVSSSLNNLARGGVIEKGPKNDHGVLMWRLAKKTKK